MNSFSIFGYQKLSSEHKKIFNSALAQRLSLILNEIKDRVILEIPIEELISSNENGTDAATIVCELYSKVSAGIQVGSGDQNLFASILNIFVESWNEVEKKHENSCYRS